MRDELEMREDYHARVRPDVLELVPDRADKVLDVGGGIGANVAHLKRMGKARFGAVADLVAHQCLPDVDAAFAGDLEQPDVLRRAGSEAGPFDAILCLDVLEHLKDPWSTVRECHKLLKPNGVIVASIPNARNYRFVLPLPLKGRLDYTDEGILDRTHLRWFVRSTAVELMTCSGLALEQVQGRYYGRKKDILNSATFGVFDYLLFLQHSSEFGERISRLPDARCESGKHQSGLFRTTRSSSFTSAGQDGQRDAAVQRSDGGSISRGSGPVIASQAFKWTMLAVISPDWKEARHAGRHPLHFAPGPEDRTLPAPEGA